MASFERFEISRHRTSGGHQSIFTARCSKCQNTKEYISNNREMNHEVVTKAFKRWGWLLSKNQHHHICPSCLRVSPENKLAERFKVTSDGQEVPRPRDIVDEASRQLIEQQSKTAEILSRHLPQPKPRQEEDSSVTTLKIETGLSPEQTLALTETLNGINKTLLNLTAAVELLAEQQAQIIGATAQIVPALARSTEGIGGRIDALAETVRTTLEPKAAEPAPAPEPVTSTEPVALVAPAKKVRKAKENKNASKAGSVVERGRIVDNPAPEPKRSRRRAAHADERQGGLERHAAGAA